MKFLVNEIIGTTRRSKPRNVPANQRPSWKHRNEEFENNSRTLCSPKPSFRHFQFQVLFQLLALVVWALILVFVVFHFLLGANAADFLNAAFSF